MLHNLVRRTVTPLVEYSLEFLREDTSGFSFPCDKDGNVFPLEYPAAKENLEWCMANADTFDWHGVRKYTRLVKEPAHGTCSCGAEVFLYDQYLGACPCPECGRWYNLFGQELTDPIYWETDDDYDSDYYYNEED